MGLAAFNRMRRRQAEEAAKKAEAQTPKKKAAKKAEAQTPKK